MEKKHDSVDLRRWTRANSAKSPAKADWQPIAKGTAHEFTTEEARFAGRKGGQQVSANRSHMIEIGRLGGRRSAERRRNRPVAKHQQPAQEEELLNPRPWIPQNVINRIRSQG